MPEPIGCSINRISTNVSVRFRLWEKPKDPNFLNRDPRQSQPLTQWMDCDSRDHSNGNAKKSFLNCGSHPLGRIHKVTVKPSLDRCSTIGTVHG